MAVSHSHLPGPLLSQDLLSLHLILAKTLRSDALLFSNWQKNNTLEEILRAVQCPRAALPMEPVFLCLSPVTPGSRQASGSPGSCVQEAVIPSLIVRLVRKSRLGFAIPCTFPEGGGEHGLSPTSRA